MLIRIDKIADYVGQKVTLQGWVHARTDKGKLHFVQLRDGAGMVQCVAFQKEVPESVFETARKLTQESAVVVTGTVRADERAPGVPGGYEVGVADIQLLQAVEEYPITPKEHGVEFLLDRRHLWIRSSRQWAILRVRATVMRAIRAWLDENGFVEISTPIITPTAAEGTSTLFEIDYFGQRAYLAQTGQLYNEANIAAFGKVYCFGPTFRAEKSKTRRHLTEFWMVEPEIAHCNLSQLLEIEEQFVSHIVQTCLRERAAELTLLQRDLSHLENISPPFARITYDEAIQRLQGLQSQCNDPEQKALLAIEWGNDFGAPHETALTEMFTGPVFVTHYPTAVKAFYMTLVEDRPEVCYSADLLAPEGYGEIIGGSERIHEHAMLLKRIQAHDLPRENYAWYLDLRKNGSVPHAGFGLVVERTIAWICGIEHIRDTIPYPHMLNRSTP
jgi:asparaginyl-tRNA synthetase